MQKQVLLTDEGLKKLQAELDELKTVRRKEIAEKIKVALSYGDLSENSEYDDAKNEQAILEARIAEIDAVLKNAKLIDLSTINKELVHVGTKVKVLDCALNEEIVFHIVGSNEADPLNGKISDESPVGKALVGAKAGDEVEVETPAGIDVYKVLELVHE